MEILKNKIASSAIRRRGGNRGGFSLLELLIYIAILSILMVVISNILISFLKANGQSQSKNEVNSSIRFVGELLRQDIRNASSVSEPASPAGTSSSTLILTRNGVTITYDTSGGILRRQENGNPTVDVTNSKVLVGTPIFTRIENANSVFNTTSVAIAINMTFSYNSASPDLAYSDSLQTTVSLY